MRSALLCCTLAGAIAAGCAAAPAHAPPDRAAIERHVADTERAFARTMAERDLAAFSGFLSEEAIFFSGPEPLRGKQAVAAFWKRFFDKPAAPFSWQPDRVEALESGTLALSTGPVLDPGGQCIGRFTSIWRQESPGVWRIVFDKGGPCSAQ
jgi:ketosteroid isomerase-like protein